MTDLPTAGPASSIVTGQSMASFKAWNAAAVSGQLEDFEGNSPGVHPITVSWMARSMGNDREAGMGSAFPVAGMFVVFAAVLMMALAAIGAW